MICPEDAPRPYLSMVYCINNGDKSWAGYGIKFEDRRKYLSTNDTQKIFYAANYPNIAKNSKKMKTC